MHRRISLLFAFAALVLSAGGTCAEETPAEGWITASDGARIHYFEMGKGVPVILIHGASGSAEGWFRLGIAQALAANHRVVAIDCRGHGQSDESPSRLPASARAPRNPRNSWWWTDVIELMDHLKIEKAHIHGYSWGGTITEHLLAIHQERMITAAIGGWGIPEEDPEMKAKVPPDSTGREPRDAELMAQITAVHKADRARFGAAAAADSSADSRKGRDSGAQSDGGAVLLHPKFDLTKVKIPVLGINGEFDQPNAKTARMAREIPNFKNVVLAGRSHLSALRFATKEYLEALSAFINANDPKP